MATWTDPTLSNSIKVKSVHVNEVKNALQTLINNANLSSSISIGTVNTGGKVLEKNIANLEKAINSLEASFSNNCSKTCQSSKCESCQDSCVCQSQSCQSNKCQTCQSECDCNCNCNCDCGDDGSSGCQ